MNENTNTPSITAELYENIFMAFYEAIKNGMVEMLLDGAERADAIATMQAHTAPVIIEWAIRLVEMGEGWNGETAAHALRIIRGQVISTLREGLEASNA